MSNIVAFSGANLPAVSTLATSLRSLANDVGSSGVVILKMDKTGTWCFGADQTEVQEGSQWAVNPFSFIHGYIAWGEGEVLGEKMVPLAQPLPDLSEMPAPPNAKKGWELQLGMSLKCLNGEDAGMECRYTATSVGGKKAVQSVGMAIATQVDKDQSKPVPVVTLETDHYQHKQFGRIFTPEFKIVEFIGMEGKAEPAAAPAPAVEAPKRGRPPVTAADVPTFTAPAAEAPPPAAEEAPRRRRRAV